jgi:NitT/TauT family transport system permease protein
LVLVSRAESGLAAPADSTLSARLLSRGLPWIVFWRLVILGTFLALWQWAPQLPVLPGIFHFLDPFFISSPERVGRKVWELLVTGVNGNQTVWSPLGTTLGACLSGTAIGTVIGMALGLLLSESDFLERVCRPYVVALNAVPRVALIPIIVIIVGNNAKSSAITSCIIVVFLVFYNAFEGGRSVSREILQNATVFGAGRLSLMLRIRLPFVVAWTFATLPNAISFGLVGAVTAELFTGAMGIGQVLVQAVNTVDATLTFAVVVILSATGVIMVVGTSLLRGKVLHWWETGDVGS